MMIRKSSSLISPRLMALYRWKSYKQQNINPKQTINPDFINHVRARLDRLAGNRTLSHRKKNYYEPPVLNSRAELEQVKMPVDDIVGILSRSKKIDYNDNVGQKADQLTQREIFNNQERTSNPLADISYYDEGVMPIRCQYTKELETRDNKAEDKLLKFPIDNEEIVWEESHVPFTEHIFLHKYIALFPPVTHRFMETIITALQNNPDLTADKKKQIIWSYLNYFNFYSDSLEDDVEDILKL